MSCSTLEPVLIPEPSSSVSNIPETQTAPAFDPPFPVCSEPQRTELGTSLGEVRSMSEYAQGCICLLSIVLGLGMFFLQDVFPLFADIPFAALAIVCVTIGAIAYWIALRISAFTERVEVFEFGAIISLKGKRTSYRYADAEQLTTSKTDYETKHKLYLGSRVELTLQIAGRLRPLQVSLEARNGTRSDSIIRTLIELTEASIQKKLMDEIESSGEIRWTSNVFLTLDSLRIREPGTPARDIPIEDIGHCDQVDNEIRLFQHGEGLPILSLATAEPNFMPTLRLFQSLHQLYRTTDGSQESMSIAT